MFKGFIFIKQIDSFARFHDFWASLQSNNLFWEKRLYVTSGSASTRKGELVKTKLHCECTHFKRHSEILFNSYTLNDRHNNKYRNNKKSYIPEALKIPKECKVLIISLNSYLYYINSF